MNDGAPRVSVITPFYNTADYLAECIASVLAQTFRDFEYVLVDNYSTDGSGEIARQFAETDDRIRLVSPPQFLSQCDNFNFALGQMSPQVTFCKMVLADDWLFPRCLDEMVALAESNPSVGLVSSYQVAETEPWGFGLPIDRTVFTGREAGRAHLIDGVFPFGNQTAVMYRAQLIRDRPEFFDDARVFFDTDTAFRILTEHDFGFVHQVLSFNRDHPGSISERIRSFAPHVADRWIVLRNFGRDFLSDAEFDERVESVERYYYEGLAAQWLRERWSERNDDYWAYQRRCVSAAGATLDRRRLAVGVARVLAKRALSPLDLVKSARDRRGRTPVERDANGR